MRNSPLLKRPIAVLAAAAMIAVNLFSGAAQNLKVVHAAAAPYYTQGSSTYRNVMYYGDWSTGSAQGYFNPDKIPADKLTHLNFAFLDFDRNGNLQWCEEEASTEDVVGIEGAVAGAANAGILSGLIELRAKHPNLRIGVSVGGWAKSGDFAAVAKNDTIRKRFADNLAKFVKYTQMDFVDIDWEYPGNARQPEYMDNQTNEGTPESSPADKANYIKLLTDIRASLDELSREVYVPDYSHWDPMAKIHKYYELSVAISANESVLSQGTDIAQVFAVCDFVNVMTYDTTGQWDMKAGHHTALKTNPAINNLSVENTVNYLLSQGAVADKIVIGCAFYSRGWQSVQYADGDADIAELPGLGWTAQRISPGTDGYKGNANGTVGRGADNYQPTVWGDGGYAAGIWPFYNMEDLKACYPGLQYYYDTAAEAPYLYAENGAFFTFDDERSVTAKAEYVKANNLGGLIAWMQSQDGETTAGSNVRDKLTTAMKNGLFGESSELTHYQQFEEGPDIGITYVYNDTTNTIDFTLKNKSSLSEHTNVLRDVEESYQTIFTPTLYIKMKPGETLTANGEFCSVEMKDDVAIVYLYEYDDMLDPKESFKFSLEPSTANSYGVDSIILTQRIVPTASEFYYKVLTWSPWETSTVFETPAPKPIQPPTLTVASKTMEIAQKQQAVIRNPVKGSVYTYNSSNRNVAEITADGVITAKSGGTAEITCSIKTTNHTYTLTETITVSKAPQLAEASKSLIAGESSTLSVVDQLKDSTYTWASSNAGVVSVSNTGAIKAVQPGKATITCTVKTKYHTYSLSAAVSVAAAPALSEAAKTLIAGDSHTLKVINQIGGSAYTWKSSNTKVATVTAAGAVKAISAGKATITCTVNAGNSAYHLTAAVTVSAAPAMSVKSKTLTMGKSHTLSVKNKISNSTYKWVSSKKSVATVTGKGSVKALKPGTATITCTVKAPNKTYTLKTKITVKGPKLAKSSLSLKKGRTAQVKLTNKISGSKYTYKSAKASIAKVNSKGIIRGIKKGTAKVSVKITFPAKLKLKAMTLNVNVKVK